MKLFITGTDTHVGKTYATVQLLNIFKKIGLTTLGLKPISSGGLDDTNALMDAATIKLAINHINPFAFPQPIAPHIAATIANTKLNIQQLNHQLRPAFSTPADICLIEGAGGWYTPLNEKETYADFVCYHRLPVLLVVGIRLGCINHALLTIRALQQDGIKTIGWIANCVDQTMAYQAENIATLTQRLPMPCYGIIPYRGSLSTLLDLQEMMIQ